MTKDVEPVTIIEPGPIIDRLLAPYKFTELENIEIRRILGDAWDEALRFQLLKYIDGKGVPKDAIIGDVVPDHMIRIFAEGAERLMRHAVEGMLEGKRLLRTEEFFADPKNIPLIN